MSVAEQLQRFRGELVGIEPLWANWSAFEAWAAGFRPFARQNFPEDLAQFDKLAQAPPWLHLGRVSDELLNRQWAEQELSANNQQARDAKTKLLALIDSLAKLDSATHSPTGPMQVIEKLLTRFHQVAQQLKKRRDGRDSLWIGDEYDVQDLLHALLKIDFDDIRPEEWTPSYAGKSAKMDFLLKKPKVVIEVKMTREHLSDKEIGDQLLVDIARYENHPDCRTLVCFIYDPEQRLKNPAGLKHDLERNSARLAVVVHVCQH